MYFYSQNQRKQTAPMPQRKYTQVKALCDPNGFQYSKTLPCGFLKNNFSLTTRRVENCSCIKNNFSENLVSTFSVALRKNINFH